jgi:hypothetical protein
MAYTTQTDANGNIISASLNNPSFGNVSALSNKIPLPNQNEVFWLDKDSGMLGVRQGNSIYAIKPGSGGSGSAAGRNYATQQLTGLGLTSNQLREFNSGDIAGALGIQPVNGATGFNWISNLSQFKGLTPGTGSTAVTSTGGVGSNVGLSNQALTNIETQAGRMPILNAAQKSILEAENAWQNPVTGQVTAAGIGMPKASAITPPPGATYISNPADLKGLTEADLWRDPNSYRIYKLAKANLIGPNGQKKVVNVGSPEANNLLANGWSLGSQINDGTVTTALLKGQSNINIAGTQASNTYGANTAAASATSSSSAADAEITRLQQLLTPQQTELSKQVAALLGETQTLAGTLIGRGAMQTAEEQKRGIEEKTQALTSKNTELKAKLAEINSLDASYNMANTEAEGRVQTLSRLQGQEAQNYKMYLAQKNFLTSQASYLQAELLGMQGELNAAQSAADRAVNLAYQDKQDAYNAKIAQLNILQPQLEKEEAKYADAVKLYLQNQADALDTAKQTQQNQNKIILGMIADYPDAGISFTDTLQSAQSKLKNSKVYQQATRLARGGGTGGGTGGGVSGIKGLTAAQEKQFWSEIDSGRLQLQKGETWGNVWNRIHAQFPQVSADMIDNGLGTSWRQPGAYQEWNQKTGGVNKSNLTPEQLSTINDAKAAIDQVKQRFGDWNATRSQIIDKVKQEDGFDISPYI